MMGTEGERDFLEDGMKCLMVGGVVAVAMAAAAFVVQDDRRPPRGSSGGQEGGQMRPMGMGPPSTPAMLVHEGRIYVVLDRTLYRVDPGSMEVEEECRLGGGPGMQPPEGNDPFGQPPGDEPPNDRP